MLQKIIAEAKEELARSSNLLKRIIEDFQSCMNEFLALSEHLRLANPDYDEALSEMLDVICENFNIVRQLVHVKPSNYTTDAWGNVYWKFLHLASILITYLLSNHKIESMLNLPLLVYNIDYVLPCPLCATHYSSIKSTNAVKSAIKEIAFGNAMSGLQAFHNLVTENVDKTLEYMNRPKRPLFTIVDFAKVYKCVELPPSNLLKSVTYIRNQVDWQPDAHRILTTFHALASRSSYLVSSEFLKKNVYPKGSTATTIEESLKTIRDGILMNIDSDLLSVPTNLQIYNNVLRETYSTYPECVENLIRELPDDDDEPPNNKNNTDRRSKKEILMDTLKALRK
jgi:hypothetical protein